MWRTLSPLLVHPPAKACRAYRKAALPSRASIAEGFGRRDPVSEAWKYSGRAAGAAGAEDEDAIFSRLAWWYKERG